MTALVERKPSLLRKIAVIILLAGSGAFEQAHITMTEGVFLGGGEGVADALLGKLDTVADRAGESVPERGEAQYRHEMDKLVSAQAVAA